MSEQEIREYLLECKIDKDNNKLARYSTVKSACIASSGNYGLFAEYVDKDGVTWLFCNGRPYITFTETKE